MLDFINFITENHVVAFFLLFIRIGALMLFFPFFSHMQIPIGIKTALAFMLSIFLFPMVQVSENPSSTTIVYFVLESLSELLFGLCAGVGLMLVFGAIRLAAEQISMVMGFSIASVIDPQSGVNMPIISNVLNFITLLAFLLFDGHHLILQFLAYSLHYVPLGSFYPGENLLKYSANGVVNMFLFGFIISFPILALSLLADLIFGMLMKTMPQFNLLVIGFPIKITISFFILTAILAAIVKLFTVLITKVLNDLPSLFFQ